MSRIFFNVPGLVDKIAVGDVTMTTRLKAKKIGRYKIVRGSLFRQVDTGLAIEIFSVRRMTLGHDIKRNFIQHGFASKEEFKKALLLINKKNLRSNCIVYVHKFGLIKNIGT